MSRWRWPTGLQPALLMSLLGLGVAAGLSAQDFETVAFGDSITAAEGGGPCGTFPCLYDEVGTYGHGGYPARLESTNGTFGLGPNYSVANKGVPGENTAEGLSRLSGVLAAGYHVLLLMEGTNDVIYDGISAETVKANLRSMDQKAVPFGTDTVFAAIIRKNKKPNEAIVTAVKNHVVALAAERSRYVVVDTWTRLCPDTACFNAHYFFTDPADDPAGHPDASGFDIMAEEWHDVIASKPVPAFAPALLGPIGVSGEASPTFSISTVANANYYQVEVSDAGGVVETAWYRGSDHCSGGTCELDTGHTFGHGVHSWRARSRNPRGLGPWSASKDVDIYPTSPAAPTAQAPSGSFCDSFDGVFSWTGVDRATDYRLLVEDEFGSTVVNDVFSAEALCAGTSCETSPISIGDGSFSWQVFGQNPHGEGAGSETLFVDIVTAKPASPVPISPDWETFNRRPPFVFNAASTADLYQVQIDGINQFWADADAICEDGVCTWTPFGDLAIGTRSWKVRAQNCQGIGVFSGELEFDVLSCNPPEVVLPITNPINNTRTEAGCLRLATSPGDPGYRIVTGDVIFHTSFDGVIEIFTGFVVEAGGTFTAVADQ